MALKLKVTQVRSGIGRPKPQRLVLKGLGLRRINKSVILQDTPAIRGMIRKVSHLVDVQPVE
jgi:large subunit ribosomal protein L30